MPFLTRIECIEAGANKIFKKNIKPVFKIKVLYCAHDGCIGSKNRTPGSCSCVLPYIRVLIC